jgi:hypothetical protein
MISRGADHLRLCYRLARNGRIIGARMMGDSNGDEGESDRARSVSFQPVSAR